MAECMSQRRQSDCVPRINDIEGQGTFKLKFEQHNITLTR